MIASPSKAKFAKKTSNFQFIIRTPVVDRSTVVAMSYDSVSADHSPVGRVEGEMASNIARQNPDGLCGQCFVPANSISFVGSRGTTAN